jgi:DNA-binding winged helix-turn-helix (wHTH) protein
VDRRLRFGDCVVDPAARALLRGGRPVEISPQGLALLLLLVNRAPQAVRHGELRDALWPDTHVVHTALPRVVSELRDALGDSPERGAFIRTVSRFGYAFVAPVVHELGGQAGECAFVTEAREVTLPEGETLVGRGPECGVRLASPQASRIHARVTVRAGGAVLEDCCSKNGTWVNGTRLEARAALEDGDEVLFGGYRVVFRRTVSFDSTRSAP